MKNRTLDQNFPRKFPKIVIKCDRKNLVIFIATHDASHDAVHPVLDTNKDIKNRISSVSHSRFDESTKAKTRRKKRES